MKPLNNKQQRFVNEYCVDLNATQAAIRAGYSEKTARFIGAENLSKPNISAAISELQKQAAARNQIDVDSLLNELEIARVSALSAVTPQVSAAVAATMGKAKLTGKDKIMLELTGANGGAIEISNMENAAKLAGILAVAQRRKEAYELSLATVQIGLEHGNV